MREREKKREREAKKEKIILDRRESLDENVCVGVRLRKTR